MNAAQARDFLYNLSAQPAMKKLREHEETLEEIVCLLDDIDTFLKHLDRMPDIELEDSYDQKWIEKTRQMLAHLKSYGDTQFLENVAKGL